MKFQNLLVSFMLLLLTGQAFAEIEAKIKSVTLEEIRGRALSHSPLVKSIELDRSIQNEEAEETFAIKNLEADLLYIIPSNDRGADGRGDQPQIVLSQPLRISDFGTRSEVSKLIKETASLDKKISILELSQKIRLNYITLWALQEKKRLVEAAKNRLYKASSVVKKSLASGLIGNGQALAFEAESKKLEAEMLGLNAEIEENKAKLIKLTSFSDLDLTTIRPVSEILPPEEFVIAKLTSEYIPLKERAALKNKLAEEKYQLAKKDSYPIFSPKLFYGKDPSGFNQIGAGVAFEIPLWYQNQGEIERADSSKSFSNAEKEYFSNDAFKLEIISVRKMALLLEQQAMIYENEIIPKLRQALSALIKQYEFGSATVFEVLQSQREQSFAESEWLELIVKSMSSRIELSILMGEEI